MNSTGVLRLRQTSGDSVTLVVGAASCGCTCIGLIATFSSVLRATNYESALHGSLANLFGMPLDTVSRETLLTLHSSPLCQIRYYPYIWKSSGRYPFKKGQSAELFYTNLQCFGMLDDAP